MNALFHPWNEDAMLSAAWRKRKQTLDAEKFQPYADLLLDQVVWPTMVHDKDRILSALKQRIETANALYELTVPVWSFSTVFGEKLLWAVGGPYHYHLYEAGNPDAVSAQFVHENGWDFRMEVLNEDDEVANPLQSASLYHIIKKTTFLKELSLRFGSSYRVTLDGEGRTETDPNGKVLNRKVFTLNLHYYPNELPKNYEEELNQLKTTLQTRTRRTLGPNEVLKVTKGSELVTKVLGPPPLITPPRRSAMDRLLALQKDPEDALYYPSKKECIFNGMYADCRCRYHSDDSDDE